MRLKARALEPGVCALFFMHGAADGNGLTGMLPIRRIQDLSASLRFIRGAEGPANLPKAPEENEEMQNGSLE